MSVLKLALITVTTALVNVTKVRDLLQKNKTRKKSNASFEALQYRQDLFSITH